MPKLQAREDMIERLAKRQPEHFTKAAEAGRQAVEAAAEYMSPVALANSAGNLIVDTKEAVIEEVGLIEPYDAVKTDRLWAIHYGAETAVHGAIEVRIGRHL